MFDDSSKATFNSLSLNDCLHSGPALNPTNFKMFVCIRNWAFSIEAFQDQYKQTMINKYSNKHNYVKNPNWQEADQLAIYQRSREVELGATEHNIS